MKKILVIILFLATSIKSVYSQKGIDVSVIPVDYNVFGFKEESIFNDKINQVNRYGLSLGYFAWVEDNIISSISLKVSRGSGEAKTVILEPSNLSLVFQNHDVINYNYTLSFKILSAHNELDFNDHIYFGLGFDYVYRNLSTNLSSSKPVQNQNDINLSELVDIEKFNTTGFDFAITFILGYQYNIKKMLGIYAQLNPSFTSVSNSFNIESSIGTRVRFN